MSERTIAITGASRGLGLALARHWAAQGDVVVSLSRSAPPADAGPVGHIACDLADPHSLAEAGRRLLAEHPRIDLLVNNAAVLASVPLGVMAAADITRMVDINLKAPMLLSKTVFRRMVTQRRGQIVNMLSMAPRLCVAGDSVYAATKAGLEAFARVLNREGHAFGVHVNNIGLSAFPSGMLDKVIGNDAGKVLQLIPHRQFAPLHEVVNAIEFFQANALDVGGQTLYFGGVAA